MKFLGSDEGGLVSRLLGGVGAKSVGLVRGALSQMTLGDPTDFILQLLASAVAGGASFVELNSDGLDFVMEFDGAPLTAAQLQNLFTGLEQNLGDLQVRKLALGLNAAFATEIDQIVLETWNGTSGLRLTLTPKGQMGEALRVNPMAERSSTTRIRFLERGKIRKVTRFVTRFQGASLPECEALQERCQQAGPTILVNKLRINHPVDLGPSLSWAVMAPAKPLAALEIRCNRPRRGLLAEVQSTGPFYAVLALGCRYQDSLGLRLVAGGTTVSAAADLGFRSAAAIASAHGLESDNTHMHAVSNSVHDNLVAILRDQLATMALELLQKQTQFDSEEAPLASAIFYDLALHLHNRNRSELAERAVRASLELLERHLGPNHPDLLPAFDLLGDVLRAAGKQDEQLPLAQKQIPILRAQAANHVSKHRIEEAVPLLRRALELEDHGEPPPPGLAQRYHELAVMMKERRLPGAEPLFLRALALQESQGGAEAAEDTVDSLRELADRYRVNKQYSDAEATARKALTLAEQQHAPTDKALIPILQLLAEILKASNRYGEATDYESRAVRIRFGRK